MLRRLLRANFTQRRSHGLAHRWFSCWFISSIFNPQFGNLQIINFHYFLLLAVLNQTHDECVKIATSRFMASLWCMCTNQRTITQLRVFQQRVRPGWRSSTSCRRVNIISMLKSLNLTQFAQTHAQLKYAPDQLTIVYRSLCLHQNKEARHSSWI